MSNYYKSYFYRDEKIVKALMNKDVMQIITACTDWMLLHMKFTYRGHNIYKIKNAINDFLYSEKLCTHLDGIDWAFEPKHGEGSRLYKDFLKQRIILNIKDFSF